MRRDRTGMMGQLAQLGYIDDGFRSRHSDERSAVLIDGPDRLAYKRRNIGRSRIPKGNVQNVFDKLVLYEPVSGFTCKTNGGKYFSHVLTIPGHNKITRAIWILKLRRHGRVEYKRMNAAPAEPFGIAVDRGTHGLRSSGRSSNSIDHWTILLIFMNCPVISELKS